MRVLVVEDEHRIAVNIKKGLEQERFAVDLAFTGVEGYDLASEENYDIIILDLMLPSMDGMEVCTKLRKNQIHTPILMLTARGQIKDKVKGLDSGADDYLTKPFSFEELLARMRALTRRPQKALSTILKVGNLTLDPISYLVKRGTSIIQLSKKEFSLFEYMMRNAGKILTKEQIITSVWDYDADILPNTVEVTIKNLRNKIDIPFKNEKPLIQTIRGFGYKLET
ncbi:DNA-binding response regulator [Candidatus Gottesmanbacteria bacterium RIFCSPHIGHO2_01_FULL_39_10]|uniref:DNA-binding response regulator n=1 Tax=Candidatus Gottesmanbacteria bacterium RIFCSPHIGHO2_01_FULL_39_10 TaxID=1798375 RepID=A0A1F5ZQ90_9BACT|nr:MAG: DNA-binding response regulator [Candidatus Gottesmanbacteria bacterium RIFCSPHIGHO2_01_FULL_39_10]